MPQPQAAGALRRAAGVTAGAVAAPTPSRRTRDTRRPPAGRFPSTPRGHHPLTGEHPAPPAGRFPSTRRGHHPLAGEPRTPGAPRRPLSVHASRPCKGPVESVDDWRPNCGVQNATCRGGGIRAAANASGFGTAGSRRLHLSPRHSRSVHGGQLHGSCNDIYQGVATQRREGQRLADGAGQH